MTENKYCPGCEKTLPVDCFGKDKAQSYGLQVYCRRCKSARAKIYRERLRKGLVKRTKAEPRKTDDPAYMKKWLESHPNYHRKWQQKNREAYRKYQREYKAAKRAASNNEVRGGAAAELEK